MRYWGPESEQLLQFNHRSESTLRAMPKVAACHTMESANKLLGRVFLERICRDRRGSGLLLMITTGDWETLQVHTINKTILELECVNDLNSEELVKFGIENSIPSMYELEPRPKISAGRRASRRAKAPVLGKRKRDMESSARQETPLDTERSIPVKLVTTIAL